MFSRQEGYRVLHVDLSHPNLNLGALARVCLRANVVLTQGGLPTACRLLSRPSTPIVMLDDCLVQWGHIELGVTLHSMLRDAGASEYRVTLFRNGYFPPGVPGMDAYTAQALGDIRVPIAGLRSVVEQALTGNTANV